jgi:hypothetical protein
MIHLLRLRVQDGMIEKVLHACRARLSNYQITNAGFIWTHIRANMINRPHTLHRRPNCGSLTQVADDYFFRTQRFQNRNMFCAMNESTNALNVRESLDQGPARFARRACDEDHIVDYTDQQEIYEKMMRIPFVCHPSISPYDVFVERQK